MLRAAALSVVVWSCVAVGCLDSSSTVDSLASPTMLTVSPASFRGAVTCGGTGLHRYVATLTDVSGGDAGHPAPISAAPTSCAVPTSFSLENSVGHAFIATIDGYDRDDIVPAAAGQRGMRQVDTGAVVCPKWQATCGDVPGSASANPLRRPTTVIELTETFITGCSTLALTPASECGADTPGDGGAQDGSLDANASDASVHDASDGGAGDAQASEAGPGDAQASDGAKLSDASDGGSLPDAQANDSSSVVDASDSSVLLDGSGDGRTSDGAPSDATVPDALQPSDASVSSADATTDALDGSAQVLGDEFREGGEAG